MEENDFLLNIVYKNKSVKFKVVNPNAPLATLMNNLRHAIGGDGRLIFDFPSIDETGAPLDYFSLRKTRRYMKSVYFVRVSAVQTRLWPIME